MSVNKDCTRRMKTVKRKEKKKKKRQSDKTKPKWLKIMYCVSLWNDKKSGSLYRSAAPFILKVNTFTLFT